MVSSTTPKLAPKCPSFVATISIINARNSFANCGSCSGLNFLKSVGADMCFNKLVIQIQKYNLTFCVRKTNRNNCKSIVNKLLKFAPLKLLR